MLKNALLILVFHFSKSSQKQGALKVDCQPFFIAGLTDLRPAYPYIEKHVSTKVTSKWDFSYIIVYCALFETSIEKQRKTISPQNHK